MLVFPVSKIVAKVDKGSWFYYYKIVKSPLKSFFSVSCIDDRIENADGQDCSIRTSIQAPGIFLEENTGFR